MTNKTTNKIALQTALYFIPETPEHAEVRAKIVKMIEQLDKKNASPKKLTENQTQNIGFKELIRDYLTESGKGATVTDVMTAIPELSKLSNQRVSAIMKQMKDEGIVEKYSEKRRTYFRIADGAEVEGD